MVGRPSRRLQQETITKAAKLGQEPQALRRSDLTDSAASTDNLDGNAVSRRSPRPAEGEGDEASTPPEAIQTPADLDGFG